MNAVVLALAITLVPTLCAASDPRAQRGRTFAQANCAQCHAVGPVGESPLRIAPPFRTLHERYPVDTLRRGAGRGHRHGPSFDAGIPSRHRADK
jgi:cytochrome c